MINPIFEQYNTPYGAYPFDKIQDSHYKDAFEVAIAEKRAEVDRIINSVEDPTFENTILALERCGSKLECVSGLFFNLLHAHSNDTLMKISEEITPLLSDLSSHIILSNTLFQRIQSVYSQRDSLGLTPEELRLLTNCYEGFAENGALLNEKEKERLKELSQELSHAGLMFGQNNLKDQKRYKLHLTNAEDIDGIPASALELAKEKAQREGLTEGWLFDLSAPSYFAFMQHCKKSELRKLMYTAKSKVGNANDEFDNKKHIITLVNGRLEEAHLLGHPTFAHYALDKRMAKSPDRVLSLLDQLLEAYKPIATQEIKSIEHFATTHSQTPQTLTPWDYSYWAEQYRQTEFQLDDEVLRPYFELQNVTQAVFSLASQLYGISFLERSDIPVYHPDVRVYEVIDTDKSFLGLLYTDFFPRENKRSGAWMNNLQEQYYAEDGSNHRPHIVLVMNFTPPNSEGHSLLTLGEVNTFLHEFGHALHGLFSQCRFSSLSGTGVARDFVELPSQIMENWAQESEWLKSFAVHYQTNEPLPDEYIQRIERARHFLVGYATCRQLSFGYLDMAWHSIAQPLQIDTTDIATFEHEAWQHALLLDPVPEVHYAMSSSFGHIFSGGYSAGYYSYKWSEVLDADAFAEFKKHGLYNQAVAQRFRDHILSQGDKQDAEELYVAFKGQGPSITALLERDGITTTNIAIS